MVKKCASYNIGLRKIATDDGGLLLQMIYTVAVVLAGIYVHLNVLQWTVIALISIVFLSTGIYRSAAYLLTSHDHSISTGQAIRIKALSNMLMAFTAGISFFTYLMIFMPKINQML
ncbi:MAG: hypothetical protein K8R52_07770 [Bacteroidales bacterium]|nr:hypothetical protein [Bacteroidales bacterium]